MARKYLVPIDLTKQELQNARIQNLASAPADPVAGQIYFNTSDNTLYFYSGTAWVAAKTNPYSYADTGETTDISITATESNGTSLNLARADHQHAGPGFGNPSALSFGGASAPGVASTVSRSDHSHAMPAHDAAAHSTIKISDLAAPTTSVAFNSQKITGLADPTNPQEAATKAYIDGRKVTDLTAPTSAFSMNSQKITNLAQPASDQDAATKKYVDDKTLSSFTAGGNVSLGNNKITNLAAPTADTDAANKGYVDNAISGLDWKTAANLLADSNLSLSGTTGTLVVDGHPALTAADNGYRLLLKGQSTASENGIYVYEDLDLGTYSLVRADDANVYTELVGAAIFIQEGTAYGSTAWIQSNHYISSFSNQVWTQFSGQGTYSATNGVQLNGNVFSFNPNTSGGLGASASGAFIRLQTNSGLETTSEGLAVGAGTGISVSGNQVSISNFVARRWVGWVGDGYSTSITVTHNFGIRDVVVSLAEAASPYAKVEADIEMTTLDTVTFKFAVAPSSNQYRATIIG